jgi:hypothetical protein
MYLGLEEVEFNPKGYGYSICGVDGTLHPPEQFKDSPLIVDDFASRNMRRRFLIFR